MFALCPHPNIKANGEFFKADLVFTGEVLSSWGKITVLLTARIVSVIACFRQSVVDTVGLSDNLQPIFYRLFDSLPG